MKKIVSFILAVLLCLALSISTFADDFLDKPVVQKPVVSGTVDVSVPTSNKELSKYYEQILDWARQQQETLDDTINAELSYFFTVLLNDSYKVSTGTYKLPDGTTVSGTAYRPRATHFNGLVTELLNMFDPDYLHAYFDIFKRGLNDYNGSDFMESTIGFRYAPNTNSAVAYTSPLYPMSYDFDSFSDYYNTLYAKYLEENGSSGISVGYENENSEKYVQPVKVPASDFKKYIDETDLVYYPTGRVSKISWKTDSVLKGSNLDRNRYGRITFMYQGNFFNEKNLKDCYCALYYYDGTDYFYSQNGFHFYLDEWSDDSGGVGTSLFYDSFNFLELADVSNDNQVYEDISGMPYISFRSWYSPPYEYQFASYSELGQYLANSSSYSVSMAYFPYASFAKYFFKSTSLADLRENILLSNSRQFWGIVSSYCSGISNLPVDNVPCDWGFIYSDQKFTMDGFGADIDTTKIPDNYYITVNGDTIYDYSITNPETGQSSTINEFMTNNYTYITNNSGGDSSGTTGGNVTVGGNVNVSGKVDIGGKVDINVNVSGAGDSGGDPPEIGGVDDLVDYLPEKSPAINEYLKIFFDTLPPELLGLILAGVATAIIILIFRR